MTTDDSSIRELVQEFSGPEACAAWHLCDRHNPTALAFRIVKRDLSERDLTYGDLRDRSERLAASLHSMGIQSGDRVATLMGKSCDYLVVLLAIWRLGAVHVPLFTAFAPPAIAFRLVESGARAIVCDIGQRDKLADGPDMPDPLPWFVITAGERNGNGLSLDKLVDSASRLEEAAAIGGDGALVHIFTSGTTGKPKGVIVPIHALAAFNAYARFGLDLRPDDIFWCAADPGWAYGLYYGIIASLLAGLPGLLLEGGFSPELTFAVLAKFGVTNFAGAPTIYRALRAAQLPMSRGVNLRCASSAGEPLSPDINIWAKDVLGVAIHDHYGQTETGMLINNHHHPVIAHPLKPGSMGRALPGWRAAVLRPDRDVPAGINEVGRVAMDLAASPLAWFAGYDKDAAKSSEKFSSDGRWYITGDLGRIDEDGDFFFSSRDDDVILMAGYRIGPSEVESTLNSHPSVEESAVIAVPDEIRGEILEAFVVLRSGIPGSVFITEELQRWVKSQYAAHAFPRAIHFEKELPKTPSGKLQRFILRQRRVAEGTVRANAAD